MKKKIFIMAALLCTIAMGAIAYSNRTDIVEKHSDSCGSCRANGPMAFDCGRCGRGFSRVYTVGETDEYYLQKYSHEGFSEYKECQHYMIAKKYK